MLKKPLFVFFTFSILLCVVLFTLPINIFDGVIVYDNGIQTFEENARLSLSYFIGMGYEDSDLAGIKDFYLTGNGIFFAVVIFLGLPGLIAYRVWLKDSNS